MANQNKELLLFGGLVIAGLAFYAFSKENTKKKQVLTDEEQELYEQFQAQEERKKQFQALVMEIKADIDKYRSEANALTDFVKGIMTTRRQDAPLDELTREQLQSHIDTLRDFYKQLHVYMSNEQLATKAALKAGGTSYEQITNQIAKQIGEIQQQFSANDALVKQFDFALQRAAVAQGNMAVRPQQINYNQQQFVKQELHQHKNLFLAGGQVPQPGAGGGLNLAPDYSAAGSLQDDPARRQQAVQPGISGPNVPRGLPAPQRNVPHPSNNFNMSGPSAMTDANRRRLEEKPVFQTASPVIINKRV